MFVEIKNSEKDIALIRAILESMPPNLGILLNLGVNIDLASQFIDLTSEKIPIYIINKSAINLNNHSKFSKAVFLEECSKLSDEFIFNNIYLDVELYMKDEAALKKDLCEKIDAASDNLVLCGTGFKNPYFPYVKEIILNIVKENRYLLYKADDIWCILKCKQNKLQFAFQEYGIDFIIPEYHQVILEAEGVSPLDVIYAYRILLNRMPENDNAIASHLGAPSLEALIQTFKNSEEYKMKHKC